MIFLLNDTFKVLNRLFLIYSIHRTNRFWGLLIKSVQGFIKFSTSDCYKESIFLFIGTTCKHDTIFPTEQEIPGIPETVKRNIGRETPRGSQII